MYVEDTPPNVSSFIKSLRDIGYTFEIAVADVLDNSITANSENIKIYSAVDPDLVLCILDDGIGMDDDSLREAMRLSTKDPDTQRDGKDLGRFGLGLKTASFSQCRLLTVISKTSSSQISAKQWDVDQVIKSNKWSLNSLNEDDLKNILDEISDMSLFEELKRQKSGTLVIWQKIDRIEDDSDSLAMHLDHLKEHLSLVFHRFIDGIKKSRKVNIELNYAQLKGFNPFYNSNKQEKEPLSINGKTISVQPHVMPSFRQATKEEYKKYGTSAGYSRSQGCYLYRANRLITYATWWRIIKNQDSNQLTRIEIDISNDQDNEWGVTVTKAGYGVTPPAGIRKDLRIIFRDVTRRSRSTQTAREIRNITKEKYWKMLRKDQKNSFKINKKHPLLQEIIDESDEEARKALLLYLISLEAYLPVEGIHREMINRPHDLEQKVNLDHNEVKKFIQKLIEKGLSQEDIDSFIRAEGFDEEMFNNA